MAKHEKNKAQVQTKNVNRQRVLVIYGTGKKKWVWRDK